MTNDLDARLRAIRERDEPAHKRVLAKAAEDNAKAELARSETLRMQEAWKSKVIPEVDAALQWLTEGLGDAGWTFARVRSPGELNTLHVNYRQEGTSRSYMTTLMWFVTHIEARTNRVPASAQSEFQRDLPPPDAFTSDVLKDLVLRIIA